MVVRVASRLSGKRFWRSHVPDAAEVGCHGMATLVYSSVEIHPPTTYPDISFVCAPGAPNRFLMLLATMSQFHRIAHDPAKDGAWATTIPSSYMILDKSL